MADLKLLDFNRDVDISAEKPTEAPGLGGTAKWALYGAFAFFAAFFIFALFAPIAGGALATGIISPDGARKTVAHYEGGIISSILVKDGDRVKAGDPLVVLNATQSLAERNIVLSRVLTLKVMEARMEAEQLGLRTMFLPEAVTASDDPQLLAFIERQQSLLDQGLDLANARSGLFTERAGQIRSEIEGLNGTIDSLRSQQVFLREEIVGAEELTAKELYAKPRLLALRREEVNVDGQVASAQAQIARLRGQISEIGVQRLELEAQRQQELARQLGEVRAELAANEERLLATEDVLERTTVRSPIDGQIMSLRYKTVGGVIRSGEPIVDVVPLNARLIITAQVNPTDSDIIAPGLEAQVTFSALPRDLPQIFGTVLTVSADAVTDERSGLSYFLAEVEVPYETLVKLGIEDKLSPGMPAEVMIKTESRTLMQYMTEPFRDSFRKAFRESERLGGG